MKFMKTYLHTPLHKLALFSKIATLMVAILLFTGVLVGCLPNSTITQTPQAGSNPAASGTTTVSSLYDENMIVSLYERNIPAVVEIETVLEAGKSTFDFPQPNLPNQRAQGSGFFIDGEGHILTNNHVVENAKTVTIHLHNGKTLEAKVIGTDPQNDLALLQVSADKLDKITYLPLGNSDTIKPGQMAIAMGSPYGLEGSVTVGIISGVGRPLTGVASRTIVNVIQTDAAINPGNSGGPLLNSKGEVVGINTAVEASSRNIGFAVPINTAKAQLPALLKGGEVKSPWLGIEGMTINDELVKKLGLPVNKGIYVVSVFQGSPAAKAGLKESGRDQQGQPTGGGDIIIAVDNRSLAKIEDLLSYFNTKKPGDIVTLSLYRGDKQMTVQVELGEWGQKVLTSNNQSQPHQNNPQLS